MYKSTFHVALSCCTLLMLFTGCAAAGPSVLEFGLRRVSTTDRAKVLEGAEAILSDMGFTLVRRDADAGVLVYADTKTPATAAADTYRFTSNLKQRRIVEIRVQSVPEGHKVFARVSIQRQTTQAHRAMAIGGGGDDRPGYTPIDRGAATTTKQSTVWKTKKRDKSAERTILAAITNRIAHSEASPQ